MLKEQLIKLDSYLNKNRKMKRKVVVLLVIVAIGVIASSCYTKEICPAYAENTVETEVEV